MLDLSQFEVLTFDCYGTLIDWETGILRALRPILERHRANSTVNELLEAYAIAESKAESGDSGPIAGFSNKPKFSKSLSIL